MEHVLRAQDLWAYKDWLYEQERSEVTVRKYMRDLEGFLKFCGDRVMTKGLVLDYKQKLIVSGYAVRSVNSMLASVNSLLRFLGREDCRVKALKIQRAVYCAEAKELSKAEYMKLLEASKTRPRLHLLLQTIGGTGIRVSELKYFTVEAVQRGEVTVNAKGKNRTILLPGKLRKRLLSYAKERGLSAGAIFCTRSGRVMDRSNIWAEMKSLCKLAKVEASKVFPHNLRKLFARTFYAQGKDIAKLADLLGHSSINTTRIYIISSGWEHRRQIESLGLVV